MFTQEEKDFLLMVLNMSRRAIKGGIEKAMVIVPNNEISILEAADKQYALFDTVQNKIKNSNPIV